MSASMALFTVGLLLLAWAVLLYDRLVTLHRRVVDAYLQIDLQLKRRHELIAALLRRVRGIAESRGSDAVASLRVVEAAREAAERCRRDARQAPGRAGRLSTLALAEFVLERALARLPGSDASDRASPRSDDALEAELVSTGHRIDYAREAHDLAVQHYNAARARLPERLVAGCFAFAEADRYRLPAQLPEPRSAEVTR